MYYISRRFPQCIDLILHRQLSRTVHTRSEYSGIHASRGHITQNYRSSPHKIGLKLMATAYYWHGNKLEKVYLAQLEFNGAWGFPVHNLVTGVDSSKWSNSSTSYSPSSKGWKPLQFDTYKNLLYVTIKCSYEYGVRSFLSIAKANV